jgi:hypothetical protein
LLSFEFRVEAWAMKMALSAVGLAMTKSFEGLRQ